MYECFLYGVARDQGKNILSKPKKNNKKKQTQKKKHLFFEERFWKIGYFVFVIFGEQRDPPRTPPGSYLTKLHF